MEPTLPTPYGSPESAPVMVPRPEIGNTRSGEQEVAPERPAPQERQSGAGTGGTPPPPMPIVPLPTTTPQPAAATTPVQDDTKDNPTAAADDDLIEKEWVEKAKKVISETKHDPYAQERAVSRLQADYLHKRYGKVIKIPDEE